MKKIYPYSGSFELVLDLKTTSFEYIIGCLKAYEECVSAEQEDSHENQSKLMYANADNQQNQQHQNNRDYYNN